MNKKILVVDDIEENRYMLRALLTAHGFRVLEAENGIQALGIARREVPDMVITDLLMPEMDGFALCREWMSDDRLWLVPFIVYTATYTDTKDRQLALDLGAAAFITKPSEPAEIVETILRIISGATSHSVGRPGLRSDDFYKRYSNCLREKLDRKVRQLSLTEQALIDYVGRCEALMDTSADAIVSIDAESKIRAWNLAAEGLFGYTETEMLNQSFEILVPEDKLEEARQMLVGARASRTAVRFETQRFHQDGRRLDVAISISLLGPEIGFGFVISDLSAVRRAAAEKRRLEEQLMSSQRMESVGRLVGGVAHDFNNLLTIILSYAGFICSSSEATDSARADAECIREAGERAASLTRQLLAFGRRQTVKPDVLDLNRTVHSMEKMLTRLIGEDVDLKTDLAPNLGQIEADVSQLEQVMLNLAVNARQAMPDGGQLHIETRNTVISHDEATAHPPLRPGRYVMLTVMDTGIGMDEDTLAHAFEPFFTTKAQGTGLGLSTVYGIVKQSKGFVWICSELGKGATFKVYLPRVDRPLTSRVPPVDHGDTRGHGEAILVVEDDHMVRNLTKRILERAGYCVLVASNAGEALLVAERGETLVDLLLTDVIMPNMNGRELAQRMRILRPSLKVAFTSGYADDVIAHHGVLNREVTLIEKPFSEGSLTAAVRGVLDGRAPGGIGEIA